MLRPGSRLRTIRGTLQSIDRTQASNEPAETFNLEIAEHHNYFVGLAGILAHNGDAASVIESGFASQARSWSRIYVIVDESQQVVVKRGKVIYVGKTVQGVAGDVIRRFQGHLADKPHWKTMAKHLKPVPVDEYLGLSRVIEGHWTAFETAVWEQHFIDSFGGKLGKPNVYQAELENIINAITPEQFDAYRSGYGHNPCR